MEQVGGKEVVKVAVVWVTSCDDCPYRSHTICGYHMTLGKNIREYRKKGVPDWCYLDDPPDI